MLKNTLKKVERLYSDNLDNLGVGPKSVGWKDEGSQELRFRKLTEVMNGGKTGSRITVNELGCGYGAFYDFLRNKSGFKIGKYFGYDISGNMLDAARKKIKDPAAVFLKSDKIMRQADYSFTSGIFNVKFNENTKVWEKYIKDVLANMDKMSDKGFAFNVLTTYVDWRAKNLYYADPFFWFDFCKKSFSNYVSLLHDYELWEWTMIIKKYPK